MDKNAAFNTFVNSMDEIIHKLEGSDGRNQRDLLNHLFKLENEFKKVLLQTKVGQKVYEDFVNFIMKENEYTLPQVKEAYVAKNKKDAVAFKENATAEGRNILRAKSYFRERQNTFTKRIAKAFHKRTPETLHKYKINYEFAKWAIEAYKGKNKKKLTDIYAQICETRRILCVNNLPLAINRAHIFWSKVPVSQMEYMDMIQACSEGLLTAIDKFVPPYKTVFRSTAIGRMTLNMMEDHNATLVRLSPKEKRIIYRAKNAQNKENLSDQQDILNYINKSFKDVTADTLIALESAISQSTNLDDKQEDNTPLSDKIPDSDISVEDRAIQNDLFTKLGMTIETLSPLEIKILKLKNGDL